MSKLNVNKVKSCDLVLKDKVVAINRVVKTNKGLFAFSSSSKSFTLLTSSYYTYTCN